MMEISIQWLLISWLCVFVFQILRLGHAMGNYWGWRDRGNELIYIVIVFPLMIVLAIVLENVT